MTPRMLLLVAEYRQLMRWAAHYRFIHWLWAARQMERQAKGVLRHIMLLEDMERN